VHVLVKVFSLWMLLWALLGTYMYMYMYTHVGIIWFIFQCFSTQQYPQVAKIHTLLDLLTENSSVPFFFFFSHAMYPSFPCMLSLCAGSQAFRNAEFGEGTGPIFLEGLECNGTETSLLDCTMDVELGLTLCDHSDDAGIRCFGENLKLCFCDRWPATCAAL